ncbi:MAG: hypothetical protein AB1578_08610 [Thermodesulfobacteriota bacterium]
MTRRHPHHHPRPAPAPSPAPAAGPAAPRLEVVVKADTAGTLEAVTQGLSRTTPGDGELRIIGAGLGEVAKSDVLMATTGSRLVLGFQVPVGPRVEEYSREQGVEIRLYQVIYTLLEEARNLLQSLSPKQPVEHIVGRAKVIALFKGSRKGIILGCEVTEGRLAVGERFRVIDPAGPIHEGRIGSLHIGPDAVREARPGQQAGLKIEGFQKARVGDWVECFRVTAPGGPPPWTPRPGVQRTENSP